jgi:putative membrane protein
MQISPYIPTQMSKLARRLVLALAILQAIFMVLEMFFWNFMATNVAKFEGDVVPITRALGANMGLYNGFLAAGLAWSLRSPPGLDAKLALFFVCCVMVAGVFGVTVSWGILIAQGLPAMCALVALLIRSHSD